MKRNKALFMFLLVSLVLFISSAAVGVGWPSQDPLPQNPQIGQTEEVPETIVPGPKDIKQRTALYVFIGWMWLSIGVCIFFLRLKIKEADRLLFLDFFSDDNH